MLSTSAFPVRNEDGEKAIAVFATFSMKAGDTVQMEVTSPVGDVWSFSSQGLDVNGTVYWGSSNLQSQELIQGMYHLKAMRQDGKTVEKNVIIEWGDDLLGLPPVSVVGSRVVWQEGLELGYAFRSPDGVVLTKGNAKGGVDIPKNAARLSVSLHDVASNWTVVKTLTI